MIKFRSVGAIISDGEGRILLQKRSNSDTIFYPGFWGLFGGEIEPNESAYEAVKREINEEIGLNRSDFVHFLDLLVGTPSVNGYRMRSFFGLIISNLECDNLKVMEGDDGCFFHLNRLPPVIQIVPFDLAAINFYYQGGLIAPKRGIEKSG